MFVKLFDKLQPIKYPGFAFAWLELVSNRYFMPTLLANHEYWINFHVLILHLLKYFKSTVNEETISKDSMKTYYKGTLRVLLVMLHDWPDFLSEFSYAFCEEIPDKFI